MASLRRNKTLSPDGPTARFLYTIIKQLDLKAVNWNVVAASQGITNGHAARMRYSRFKQQIEGAATQARESKAGGKKGKEKEGKEGKEGVKKRKKRGFEGDGDDEAEASPYVKRQSVVRNDAGLSVKQERCTQIKDERATDAGSGEIKIKSEPGLLLQDIPVAPSEASPAVRIKAEPDDVNMGNTDPDPDIWQILPRATGNEVPLTEQKLRVTKISESPFAMRPSPPPPPSHLHPLSPLSTVSLAELEVSPRTQPAAVTGAAGGGGSCHRFTGGMGPVGPGVLDGSARGTMHIKAEPGSDVEWMVSRPSAHTMVKGEPAET
jgi:hypothetical protein